VIRCVHYLPSIRLEEGGVARAVLDFCGAFAALGHPTSLITGDAADVPAAWMSASAQGAGTPRVVKIDAPGRTLGLLRHRAKSNAAEALRDADVLHLHAPWLQSNLQLASLARRTGLPYVLSAHGMLDDWSMSQKRLKKRLYLTLFGNRLFRNAARIHCTAQAELQQAGRWFGPEKGVVIPLIMDPAPFRDLPGPELARGRFAPLRGDEPKLLFLSRVHPKKGIELLLRAAAELRHRRGRPCTVLIAGPGEPTYVASLQTLATELGIDQATHFLGMVRGAEKLSLYQAADCFVLPTSQENFGFVLLEAMACGTPVVTTRGVDIWQELEGAGASIVERTADAVASAIERSVADPTAAAALGQRGRQWVLDYIEPTRVAREYETLYRSIMRKPA
jgi:glycosyltransferase involved in cell wall biosynthesis